MSKQTLLINMVQSLNSTELDEFAVCYLREVDGIQNILKCDGPYDSGLDVRDFNFSDIESQYQATITKISRFESKLKSDLKKARKNVDNYNLPSKVKYFYSQALTPNKILEYRKLAKQEYDLNLEILDASVLAASTEVYNLLNSLLIQASGIESLNTENEFFDDPRVKAFYDLVSVGTATDLKYSIVNSYIINFLFNNGPTSKSEIQDEINAQFDTKLNQEYFESIINRMKSEQKIERIDNENINITEEEKERLNGVLGEFALNEKQLIKEIKESLNRYELEEKIDETIVWLSDLYVRNYSINLEEFRLRKSSGINELEATAENFVKFFEKFDLTTLESEELVKSLIDIADKYDILPRIAIGHVFSNVTDPDQLEGFIQTNHTNNQIFLDANVIINLLLVNYEPNAEFSDYQYNVANQFVNFSSQSGLNLKTTVGYAKEVTNIFKYSLSLVPFTKLPYFESLGKTDDRLYNFYLHLKDWEKLDSDIMTFESFLEEFNFRLKDLVNESNFKSQIEYLLSSLNIEIDESYPKYNLSPAKQAINEALRMKFRRKTDFAVKNDAIMFSRLGDSNVEINPIDPIFCTWDSVLMNARKHYFEDNPNCTKWFMYTPTRLMDHFSMMDLKVRKGCLSKEVLTILDSDYEFQEKTRTLLDSAKFIIDPKGKVGIKYANKLATIRRNEIAKVKFDTIPEETNDSIPIDNIFYKLILHYADSDSYELSDLKMLFSIEEKFDDIINLLEAETEHYKAHADIRQGFFESIDEHVDDLKKNSKT